MSTTGFAKVMKHDISARDFYDHILLVLGQRGGFQPNRPVAHADAYDSIFASAGVTRDEYGKQDNTGAWWVERWVQEAVKALVKKGWVIRPSRGMWALTPNGGSKAQQLDKAGVAPLKDSAATPKADNAAPKVASTSATDGVSLPVSKGMDESGCYHDDPYIRALGVQTSPCLGAFSEKSPKCKKCPVQVVCINTMAAQLSRLAAELADEDKAEELAKNQPKAPKTPPKPATDTPSQGGSKASTKGKKGKGKKPTDPVRDIRCPMAAVCAKCGGTVAQGSPAKWVRSMDGGDDDAGLYHPHCYDGDK